MDKKFYVTAKFTAKEARVTDMITLLKKLTAETKSEAGCLDYGYYQSSEDSRVFTSIEVWKTPECEMSKKPNILSSFHFLPLKRLYVVVILSRFLGLLRLLEEVAEFAEFLTSPIGSTLIFCLLSYQVFVLMGCNIPSSAILSSTVALALHCMIDRR